MKLIQAIDLQPGKMYYIESKCTQYVIEKKRRQKGIFKRYIYGKVDVSHFDKGNAASYYAKLDIAHFENVENINADDPAGDGITGSILYYTDYNRFYLPEKDEIIKNKDNGIISSVLEKITGIKPICYLDYDVFKKNAPIIECLESFL
jgi:hypothetical protein